MTETSEQAHLVARGRRTYAPNYRPRNVVFESARGCMLTDVAGKSYLDFGSGIGVNCFGHQHPTIVEALQRQVARLWHTSNVYFNEPAIRLAEWLVDRTVAERVFFCNSGAEANEAAIKVARRYGYNRAGPQKNIIITLAGAFHGRTLAALAATAQPKYHTGFGPLPPGFRYCQFDDVEHLQTLFTDEVCALMLEPIQGESGIRPVSEKFLRTAAELCEAQDALLIADEIQCGMGRTGRLFAYEWVPGVEPDVITVAKALGSGLPIGATLLGKKSAETLQLGSHGSTFGGNPIACEVARTVLENLYAGNLFEEITRKGRLLRAGLDAINRHAEVFSMIRGRGLMIGAELSPRYAGKASDILAASLAAGLLVLQSGNEVLRLLPPYTISDAEIQTGLQRLEQALDQALK